MLEHVYIALAIVFLVRAVVRAHEGRALPVRRGSSIALIERDGPSSIAAVPSVAIARALRGRR